MIMSSSFVADRFYIVYRKVFEVPYILHFEPSLDASSPRSDVMSAMKIHFRFRTV